MLRRNLLFALGLLLALGGCSFRNDAASVSVQIDQGQLREYLRGMNRTGFDCYFVSVDGPGIATDLRATDLGGRSPDCLGLGVNSNLLSFDDITTKRTRLRVYGGTNRRVRIMGVNTTAPTCAGQPLSGVFGTRRPSIYEVASATQDLYSDKAVDVAGSNSATGEDIVPTCDNSVPGGVNDQLVVTGGVLALSVVNGLGRSVRAYQIGTDLIPVSPVSYPATLGMINTKLRVTPNGSNLFMAGAAVDGASDTAVQRFVPDVEGGFATGADYAQTFSDMGNEPVFSGDSKAIYFPLATVLRQFTLGAKKLVYLASSQCEITYMSSITFSPDFFFFPQPSHVMYNAYPANGDVCGNIDAGGTSLTLGANVVGKMHRNGIYYQIFTQSSLFYAAAYRPEPGSWAEVHGSTFELLEVPQELYLDREGKFIFILSAARTSLFVLPLNSNGTIKSVVGPVTLPFAAMEIAIEPQSKAIYVSSGTAVVGYSLSAAGTLVDLGFAFSPAPGTAFDSIATVPLF